MAMQEPKETRIAGIEMCRLSDALDVIISQYNHAQIGKDADALHEAMRQIRQVLNRVRA